MNKYLPEPRSGPKLIGRFISRLPELTTFRRQLRTFKWLVPLGMVLLVVAYELGPSRWTYEGLGFTYHLIAEIIVFGTVGPALAFVLLELLGRWIEERETADLQSRLLAKAGEKELEVRKVGDETIQVLFATSLLITSIKSDGTSLPDDTVAQIDIMEKALNESINDLRLQLLS